MEDRLTKFGIEKANLYDLNIVGLNLGDDESGFCVVKKADEKYQSEGMKWESEPTLYKDITAISYDSGNKITIGREAEKTGTFVYRCFLRSPISHDFENDDSVNECYMDYINDGKSYRILMNDYFVETVVRMFRENREKIDFTRRTVIAVGRESVGDWEKYEVAYRDMLAENLKKRLVGEGFFENVEKCNVDVMIYPAVQAAQAYEWVDGRKSGKEPVQSEKDSLTVALGLGYICFWEFAVQYMLDILCGYLDGINANLKQMVKEGIIDALSEAQTDFLIERVKKWSDEGEDCYANYAELDRIVSQSEEKIPSEKICEVLNKKICESYYLSQIQKGINHLFNTLFSDSEMTCAFELPKETIIGILDDNSDGLRKHGADRWKAIGLSDVFGQFWNRTLLPELFGSRVKSENPPTRKAEYNQIAGRREKILKEILYFYKNADIHTKMIPEISDQITGEITTHLKSDIKRFIERNTPLAPKSDAGNTGEGNNS